MAISAAHQNTQSRNAILKISILRLVTAAGDYNAKHPHWDLVLQHLEADNYSKRCKHITYNNYQRVSQHTAQPTEVRYRMLSMSV